MFLLLAIFNREFRLLFKANFQLTGAFSKRELTKDVFGLMNGKTNTCRKGVKVFKNRNKYGENLLSVVLIPAGLHHQT